MLNRTIINAETINAETKVCPITQIVEKSITPDRVTDMYKEARDQVEKDILRKIIVTDNNLNGVILEVRDDYQTHQTKVLYRFTLNGKEHIKTDYETEKEKSAQYLVEKLYEYLKLTIADKILKENIHIFLPKTN